MNKRVLAMLLAAVMLLSLAGCGKEEERKRHSCKGAVHFQCPCVIPAEYF